MFVSDESIWSYLLDKEIVVPADIVDSNIVVKPDHTKNIIFIISNQTANTNYLLKQAASSDHRLVKLSLNEINAYRFIYENAAYEALQRFVPRMQFNDRNNYILVVDYLQHTKALNEHYFINHYFDSSIAVAQADILAAMHIELPAGNTAHGLYQELPWIFNMMDWKPEDTFPGDTLKINLVKIIQVYPKLKQWVHQLKEEWERSALIHGDIKLMNFIIRDSDAALFLIDWEAGDIGDPCWDLAGLFQTYISFWVFGIPEASAFDAANMKRMILCFWKQYTAKRKFTPQQAAAVFKKGMRFTAVRLLQTAIEALHNAPAISVSHMHCLQLAHNILEYPDLAIQDFLVTAQ